MSRATAVRHPGRGALGAMALAMLAIAPAPAAAAGAPEEGEWTFRVLLDGKPIGEHRFEVRTLAGEMRVSSEARFDVTFFGINAYRYRHRANESWRGGCLVSLTALTDDDGKTSKVRWQSPGDRDAVDGTPGAQAAEGCMMSFAYWHPALRTQTRLLNAQTGKVEPVQVGRLPEARVEVRGRPMAAVGLRVSGAARPVDVWYSADGDWIGLDAVVDGGRRLSYRLP
ncbi:MAG: DUF6134 family protein [Caldimonas sp.]